MTFRPHEIEFLRSTALGRLATIQPNGTLQNSPVGFHYNRAARHDRRRRLPVDGCQPQVPQRGRHRAGSRSWSTLSAVARPVAGALPGDPGEPPNRPRRRRPRATRGDELDTAIIRITPRRIIGFGIDTPDVDPHLLEMDARDA